MSEFTESDLRDPSPPVPGERERAAVAARAHELGRRRRILQGAGALGMVAALAVGVAALTAGGSSSDPRGKNRVEAASSGDSTVTTTAVAPTTVPAPVTTAPPPAPTGDSAAAADTDTGAVDAPPPAPAPEPPPEVAPAAPTTFTVSGTVSNIPPGATLTLTLSGPGGTFTATADGAGNYSMSGVAAGTYDGMYQWQSTDGAMQVGKLGGIVISGDTNISFALP
jgi:hypothetical protein